MSEGVFLLPRIADTTGGNSCKQYIGATAFGTAGIVLSAKSGRLYRIVFNNSNATTSYFAQLHNKATAAVNAEVPIWEERLVAAVATTGGSTVMDFGLNGLYFSAGISIAISTTKSVLTLAAATDASAYALYTATTT